MTTRHTYYMSMQIVLITAGIAWAFMIATIWSKKNESIFCWGLIIGWQIISLMFIYCFYVSYQIIAYFENILKPNISKIINSHEFWSIDSYFSKKNGKFRVLIDLSCMIFLLLCIIFTIFYRHPTWLCLDWWGLIINLFLFVIVAILTIRTVKIRIFKWNFD